MPEIVDDVTLNPSSNIHYMDNYETTMEFATSALLYAMRSIGLNACNTLFKLRYCGLLSDYKYSPDRQSLSVRGSFQGMD